MLETIEKETGANPGAAIIMMHGLGADGNDFVSLVRELKLSAVGPVRFIFPHAPVIPVALNGGYAMRSWYEVLGPDFVTREDEPSLRKSVLDVQALITRENARGVPSNRIVLAGFSQGCAMALLTGVRHAERLAGIVGMSGYLPLAAKTGAERSAANAHTPIFMGHGRFDDKLPVQHSANARDILRGLGYDVQWTEYQMGHQVCQEELEDLNRWLLKALAPR